MKTQKITLEKLAEKLNKSVWEKGDIKRIYFNDAGYNTKKMNTKTFIYEKDGKFIVSCRIDCPSQPYQWISSQEEEVKESIYSDIENALSETAYIMTNNEGKTVNYKNEEVDLYFAEVYFTEREAEKEIDNNIYFTSYCTMPRDEFQKIYDELEIKHRKEREEKEVEKLTINTSEPIQLREFISQFEIGAKYEHQRFGTGICKNEDENKVWIDFSGEEKMLLKKFAPLKKSE